jgi:glyoxylase I family protein
MITGIEHVGLAAEDPQTLVDWYITLLGFRIVYALPDRRTYFIRARNGGMIEVYPAQHACPALDNVHRGLRHIALTVTDCDATVKALREQGVAVPEATRVSTVEMKLAFFQDPEGNLLHLVERRTEIPLSREERVNAL